MLSESSLSLRSMTHANRKRSSPLHRYTDTLSLTRRVNYGIPIVAHVPRPSAHTSAPERTTHRSIGIAARPSPDAPRRPGRAAPLRVGMVIFVFYTQHANNIPTGAPEHGDHHGTLGMHRTSGKLELPSFTVHHFFHSSMRVPPRRRASSRTGADES